MARWLLDNRRWSFRRGRETLVVEVNGDRLCNNGALVRDWVLDSAGLACKSELDVRKDLESGRLQPALKVWTGSPAPLNAVYPGGGPRPVRVRRSVEFLRERSATAPGS